MTYPFVLTLPWLKLVKKTGLFTKGFINWERGKKD